MSKLNAEFTVDLFTIPSVHPLTPGDNRYARESASLISDMLNESGIDRHAIAAELSRISGKELSKHMLDGYASPARLAHALPLWMAPVLEEICESTRLTDWVAATRGGIVAYGKDALRQELGRLVLLREQTTRDINERIQHLEALLTDSSHE